MLKTERMTLDWKPRVQAVQDKGGLVLRGGGEKKTSVCAPGPVMKIDQSICNDWTLSPLKNCLGACGLKTKIASERRASLCAGASRPRIYTSFCPCVFSASAGVLFFCPACTCVLCRTWSPSVCIREPSCPPSDPRYSYVLTVEDRSPGLKLPHIHPSEGSQRQPSTRIYSFSRRCKTKYSAAYYWIILARRGEARVCRVVSSVVQLCSLWICCLPSMPHWMTLSPAYSA